MISGCRSVCWLIVLVAVIQMAGCGAKEQKASQVLARVNSEELTVHQLNEELQRINIPPQQLEQAKKTLLEGMINRSLLKQAAMKAKIEREPKVMMAIELAKDQILAQAYLQSQVRALPNPTDAEISDYYRAHPEMYMQQKNLELNQIILPEKDFSTELQAAISAAKSTEEVVGWLSSHQVNFIQNTVTRNTSELPAELAKSLASPDKGTFYMLKEAGKVALLHVVSVKDQAMSEAEAKPSIQQHLENQRRSTFAKDELNRLRTEAKIEYVSAEKPVTQPQTPKVAAPATDESKDHVDRGLAGLH